MIHWLSIGTAVSAVFLSNWISRRGSNGWLYTLQWALTLAFCYACFREVGWTGLFLSIFSPNITDILSSPGNGRGNSNR
jgi:hypothetical protein